MTRGHLIPVRLTDIPIDERCRAAQVASRQARDEQETMSLLAAALDPSERVYWVRADAAKRADAA